MFIEETPTGSFKPLDNSNDDLLVNDPDGLFSLKFSHFWKCVRNSQFLFIVYLDTSSQSAKPPQKKVIAKKPGTPELLSVQNTNVVLQWTPSKTPELVEYVMEYKKAKHWKWQECPEGSTKDFLSSCSCTVKDLEPSTQYFFRVVPFVGDTKGVPSSRSAPIFTKSLPG